MQTALILVLLLQVQVAGEAAEQMVRLVVGFMVEEGVIGKGTVTAQSIAALGVQSV